MTSRTMPPALLVAGFMIWASCFLLLYGVHALGCAVGWPDAGLGAVSVERLTMLAIWVGHLLAFAPLRSALRQSGVQEAERPFLRRAAGLATAASFAATVWTGFPATVLTTCH